MNRALLALALATTLLGTGCFGSFNAIRKTYDFNKSIDSNKFVQWGVFLVLASIQVYTIAGAMDIMVLNSMEFWTGNNPLAHGDTYHEQDLNGNSVQATRLPDGRLHLELQTSQGEKQSLILQRSEEELVVLNNNYKVMSKAVIPADAR